MVKKEDINFVFFGTSSEAIYVLDALSKKGFLPSLIVTPTDKPAGRNLELTPPAAKVWAEEHFVSTFQPEKIDSEAIEVIKEIGAEIFIVVGYGKILPQALVDLPKHKTINIHPSLLPKYRGPSPIEGAILNGDSETGVTVMLLDKEVDHGPILVQEKYKLNGTETAEELSKILFTRGGELLAEILPAWINGEITPAEQDHSQATFTKKLTKEDGLVDLEKENAEMLYRKFRANIPWPRTFFFIDKKRIIITKAKLENNNFVIEKIIPEGGKEQNYKTST
jgi:methionyl-tRNA formyltransferase